ncbi:MAG: SRPBCC family protein [Bacteroidia bacterium]
MGLTATKQNFSKYDVSGTDPNRYASVSNASEADSYLHKHRKSNVPGLRVNISTTERILMIAAGGYLLYRAIKKDDKAKVTEAISGGTMLLRGLSGYCPAYDAMEHSKAFKGKNVNIRTSFTVNKPVDEVYNAWRNLEQLPQFMTHLESVTAIDDFKSEWVAKINGIPGASVKWRAEILMDEPNEILSWHSLPESGIDNAGKIRFTDNGDSTDVDVTISYHAPLGKAGEAIGSYLTPVFERLIKKDIEGFKTYIENGVMPETETT